MQGQYSDPLQAFEGIPFSCGFSTDGSLICVSVVPHFGNYRVGGESGQGDRKK